jgi:hypothetical protein
MRGPAGAACTVDDDCDFTLACAMSVCVARSAFGASCDAGHPCAVPNLCSSGTCRPPHFLGQDCNPVANDCDATEGLYCDATTRVCVQATFAGAGQPCGLVGGGFVGCSGGGRCQIGAAAVMGTCLASAADGAACDSTNGPDCVSPAQCIGAVCKLPNPAGCL